MDCIIMTDDEDYDFKSVDGDEDDMDLGDENEIYDDASDTNNNEKEANPSTSADLNALVKPTEETTETNEGSIADCQIEAESGAKNITVDCNRFSVASSSSETTKSVIADESMKEKDLEKKLESVKLKSVTVVCEDIIKTKPANLIKKEHQDESNFSIEFSHAGRRLRSSGKIKSATSNDPDDPIVID